MHIGVCAVCAAVCADLETAEAGDACREAELAQDKLADYGAVTAGKQGEQQRCTVQHCCTA
jgi:hypothetical protein